MKKFRLVIRITFVLFIGLSLLIGFNDEKLIKEGFYFFWGKGVFTFYENMKTWGLIGFIIILTQFTLENIQLISLKGKVKAQEDEILQLKAKLFDEQKESAPSSEVVPAEGSPENSDTNNDN